MISYLANGVIQKKRRHRRGNLNWIIAAGGIRIFLYNPFVSPVIMGTWAWGPVSFPIWIISGMGLDFP